jgi:hypothetical protein
MDFDREWTVFALGAEHHAYGCFRIANAHNRKISSLKSANAELRVEVERLKKNNEEWQKQFYDMTRMCKENAEVFSTAESERIRLSDELTRLRSLLERVNNCNK